MQHDQIGLGALHSPELPLRGRREVVGRRNEDGRDDRREANLLADAHPLGGSIGGGLLLLLVLLFRVLVLGRSGGGGGLVVVVGR